jgi:hypothetical protein
MAGRRLPLPNTEVSGRVISCLLCYEHSGYTTMAIHYTSRLFFVTTFLCSHFYFFFKFARLIGRVKESAQSKNRRGLWKFKIVAPLTCIYFCGRIKLQQSLPRSMISSQQNCHHQQAHSIVESHATKCTSVALTATKRVFLQHVADT